MKLVGNLIWLLFGGLLGAAACFLVGIFLCITIIGIPFGKQLFKIAKLLISPFGKTVYSNFGRHPIANILWMIFGGLEYAVAYAGLGLLFTITIIGIPFGKQFFKMAKLLIFPFGATVI